VAKTFIAAPLLFILYGAVRWLDGTDGEYGPGLAWTIGHLLFLVAFLLFGVLLVRLRGAVDTVRPLATLATAAGFVGILAFLRVIVIDLITGFRAPDHAAMSRIGDEYDRWPGDLGIYDALYEIGPMLFVLGLLTLTILLAVRRRLPAWSPVLVLAGFAAIIASLDLMPVGGVLLLFAFLPLGNRNRTRSSPARQPIGG
jgi:uncharacterized membrane protein YhhN